MRFCLFGNRFLSCDVRTQHPVVECWFFFLSFKLPFLCQETGLEEGVPAVYNAKHIYLLVYSLRKLVKRLSTPFGYHICRIMSSHVIFFYFLLAWYSLRQVYQRNWTIPHPINKVNLPSSLWHRVWSCCYKLVKSFKLMTAELTTYCRMDSCCFTSSHSSWHDPEQCLASSRASRTPGASQPSYWL